MPLRAGGKIGGGFMTTRVPVRLPDDLAIEEVVERYRKGEVKALAEERGVTRALVYKWMLGGLGPEKYRELITEMLAARVAWADETLEEAEDILGVQKARERMRFTRMDLERRRPELYGPKQEVRHSGAVPQFVVVMPSAEAPARVIEGEKLEDSDK
jgi:hypothetical protein